MIKNGLAFHVLLSSWLILGLQISPLTGLNSGLKSALAVEHVSTDLISPRQAFADHRKDVSEFQVIREAAKELSLRVWLFGGTHCDAMLDPRGTTND